VSRFNSYLLPGLRLAVKGHPPKLHQAIDGYFNLCPTSADPPELQLDCQGVAATEFRGRLPEWLRQVSLVSQTASSTVLITGPTGERAVFAEYDGFTACAWWHPAHEQIRAVCDFREGEPAGSILPSVLVPLIREFLEKKERLLLHAAAVLGPGDVGMMFVAASGGGKTTTALSLVRRGAKLISDDLLVIEAAGTDSTVYGIPKPLNIRRGTLDAFEELSAGTCARRSPGGDIAIRPQTVYGENCLAASAPIAFVFFLKLSGAEPAVRPLTAAEAMERIIQSHLFTETQKVGPRSIVTLCEFIGRAQVYELQTGPAAKQVGDWLLTTFCGQQVSRGEGEAG